MIENQYVVFNLDKGEFGIDIMNVKEIVPYEEAIPLPNIPDFAEGVINHRGNVIPIINLRKRFSLAATDVTKNTRIIVINLEDKEVGFVVDEVSQTIRLDSELIDPAPSITEGVEKKYITGLGKIDEKRLLIIIDLDKILSVEEKEEIKQLEV